MKRKEDIDALLTRCTTVLGKIEEEYKLSLHRQSVGTDLRIDIKNFCENLRSILDYLAHNIRETHCPNAASRGTFYFPILSDKQQFEGRVGNWYPGLKETSPDLWNYLESVQPYHDAFQWIGQFNRINNENKHGNLFPQTRTETAQVRVTSSGGSVAWDPAHVKFSSGVFICGGRVDPTTQMPTPDPSRKVERIVWVDFLFATEEVSALQLLKQSLKGVAQIVDDVEKWL